MSIEIKNQEAIDKMRVAGQLAASKWMAKKMTGVRIIDSPSNNIEKWIIDTVEKQSKTVGIKMPEVGIFPSPAMNAFATGASKKMPW